MPVTVSQMALNEASVSIQVGGDTLNITYYPNKITTRSLAAMGGDLVATAQGLEPIIKQWDFLNDDGSMWAVTADNLQELGIGILTQIRNDLINDTRPN